MRKNDPLRVTEFQKNFKLDTFARTSLFDDDMIQDRCDKRRVHAVFKGQLLFQCSPNRLHLCFRSFALFFFLPDLGKRRPKMEQTGCKCLCEKCAANKSDCPLRKLSEEGAVCNV